MPKYLTRAQIDSFERDGYLASIPVLTPREVEETRIAFEDHAGRIRGKLTQQYKHKTHLMLRWADGLVHHPRVLDAVEDLLGPDILCWTTNLFHKAPGSPQFVSWHQDSAYWGLDPAEVVTAWIALTPSNRESGCLRVLPGSHQWQPVAHEDILDDHNQLTRGQTMVGVDESQATDVILEPGEISLHHIKLAHASGPNRARLPRLGFAVRFMSARVCPTGRRESALLVRGQTQHDHFLPESRPSDDFSLPGRMAHNRALRLQISNNFRVSGDTTRRQRTQLALQKHLSHWVLDGLYLKLKTESLIREAIPVG